VDRTTPICVFVLVYARTSEKSSVEIVRKNKERSRSAALAVNTHVLRTSAIPIANTSINIDDFVVPEEGVEPTRY
jgi:hypothetical protein